MGLSEVIFGCSLAAIFVIYFLTKKIWLSAAPCVGYLAFSVGLACYVVDLTDIETRAVALEQAASAVVSTDIASAELERKHKLAGAASLKSTYRARLEADRWAQLAVRLNLLNAEPLSYVPTTAGKD